MTEDLVFGTKEGRSRWERADREPAQQDPRVRSNDTWRVRSKRTSSNPIDDFQNPEQEWRRLFSEALGTFFLVLVAAGGGMMGHTFPDTISRQAAVAAPALMVMAIILFMGKVSGAHLNPAVSFALRAPR